MAILQASTWHVLGLSVAASYAGLGLLSYVIPQTSGRLLFDVQASTPKQLDKRSDEPRRENGTESAAVALALPLLGARDLSISAALFALSWDGKPREMGTVILAGMILCVADVVTVWQRKGAGL